MNMWLLCTAGSQPTFPSAADKNKEHVTADHKTSSMAECVLGFIYKKCVNWKKKKPLKNYWWLSMNLASM